ncbi:MAG: TraR/DksA family transcriptional regulator [Actinomycetota bacterium]
MNATLTAARARATLHERLAGLIRRHDAIDKHLRQQDGRLDADFSDRVAYTEMDEVLEALDDAGREEAEAIRGALIRLDEGSWGRCVRCGEGVQGARLAAVPEAALCITCAEQAG